jgi:hypothetical protein
MLSKRSLDRGGCRDDRCGGLWTKTIRGLALAMLAGALLATVPAAPPASADDRDVARAAALAAKQERIARRLEAARQRGDAKAVARELRRQEKVAARQDRVARRIDKATRRSARAAGPRERRQSQLGSEYLKGRAMPAGWVFDVWQGQLFVMNVGKSRYLLLNEKTLRTGGESGLADFFFPPPKDVAPPGFDWSSVRTVPTYKVKGAPPGGWRDHILSRPVRRDNRGRCPTMTPC